MENNFLQPLPFNKLIPISYEIAKERVEKEIDLDVLLKDIYLAKNKNGLTVSESFSNKLFFKEGRMPVGVLKNGKVSTVCPFHHTEDNGKTSVLKGKRGSSEDSKSDLIKCFKGGCAASTAISSIHVYMIMVLGVNPNVVRTKAANSEYGKALFALAKYSGFRIEYGNSRRRLTKEEQKRITYQNILNDTTDIYHQEFLTSAVAQEYFFETRGFKYGVKDSNDLVKQYKIGFAPEEFPSNFLFKKLEAKYKTEEMIEASVVKWLEFKGEDGNAKGGNPYDFHSDALILPYWSKSKVIKHYSRGLNAPKKWRHLRAAGMSDTPLNFYEGTRFESVNISEGEFSWLSLIALDYDNSLATYGTNGLSPEHVQMLIKVREESNGAYCKTLYIIYDGDKAGRDATVKTGKLLVENGFDVRVVLLPQDMDPNDILVKYKEKAKSVMDKLHADAVSYYTFLALNSISKEASSVSDRLGEMLTIKAMLAENGLTDATQLYLVAKEFSEIAKVPVEVVWESWKKENKNIEILSTEKFAFVTKDLEGYYLTKLALKGRAAYIEDISFSFMKDKEISVKSIVVDEKFYDEQERETIKLFCEKNKVKYLSFFDFKSICEVTINSQSLIDSLLKS